MSEVDPCDWCEEAIQPYLDRDLSEKRFKFESGLRRLVRQAVVEPMDPALKAKLAALRLEL
jgi:hypothetical protein